MTQQSYTAGIYSDCSTREINNGCVYYIEPATMKSDLPTTTFSHQDMDRISRIHVENREEWRTRPASDARDATFIAIVTRFSRLLHTQFPSVRWGCSVAQSPIGFALNCASSRQITTPAPHHSVLTGRMPFPPPNQQRQSTEGRQNRKYVTYRNAAGARTTCTRRGEAWECGSGDIRAADIQTHTHTHTYTLIAMIVRQ